MNLWRSYELLDVRLRSLFRSLTAAALAVSVTFPAGAQSVVGKDKTGPCRTQ